jgi:putative ABC transport system permease protein
MDIRPILATLLRHKTAAALIVLEIALSSAILCNALFLIDNRLQRMDRSTGVAETELVRIRVRGIASNEDAASVTRADLAALRSIPGVRSATSINQIPFGNGSWNSALRLEPTQQQANLDATTYMGGEHAFATLGLTLVAGREFRADEFVEWADIASPGEDTTVPAVIITQAIADRVFPGESAVGKSVYIWGDAPHQVVGVIAELARPNDMGGAGEYHNSVMFPVHVPYETGGTYVLRVDDPARRQDIIRAALKTLASSGPTRILPEDDAVSFEELRDTYYRQDRQMAWLLAAVSIALLVVTALGIVGLASFWVQQRTKQIGIRRALGATRRQILRYFQVENFLLASAGIALGMLLAYAINQLLMGRYELPRLPLGYLPMGALALWVLGQLAVFGPARRASAVPPAVATRSG